MSTMRKSLQNPTRLELKLPLAVIESCWLMNDNSAARLTALSSDSVRLNIFLEKSNDHARFLFQAVEGIPVIEVLSTNLLKCSIESILDHEMSVQDMSCHQRKSGRRSQRDSVASASLNPRFGLEHRQSTSRNEILDDSLLYRNALNNSVTNDSHSNDVQIKDECDDDVNPTTTENDFTSTSCNGLPQFCSVKSRTEDNEYCPKVSEDNEYRPTVSEDNEYRPKVSEDNEYRPTVSEDNEYRPTVSEDNEYRPKVSEDNEYRPTVSEDNEYRPTVSEDNEYRPKVSEDNEYRPKVSDIIENADDSEHHHTDGSLLSDDDTIYDTDDGKKSPDPPLFVKNHMQKNAKLRKLMPKFSKQGDCPFCGVYYGNLSQHIFTYCSQNPERRRVFHCCYCKFKTQSKEELLEHKKSHVLMRDFKCEMCDSGFFTRSRLIRHMRYVHLIGNNPVKIYTCDTCNKRFRYRSHHDRHMSIHQDEKSVQCEMCGKFFKNKHNVRNHQSRMHPFKNLPAAFPYFCEKCGEGFLHLGRHRCTEPRKARPRNTTLDQAEDLSQEVSSQMTDEDHSAKVQ